MAQNVFVTLAGANLARKKFGKGFEQFLKHIETTQWWSQDTLIDYQSQELRRLVGFAYTHCPYYRKKFDQLQLRPTDIKCVEDLRKLPILTKEDVRYNLAHIKPAGARNLKLDLKHTGGTTGTALTLYWDRAATMKEYAFVARHRRWAGVNPFDRQATFGGRVVVPIKRSRPPFWRVNIAEDQTFFSLYHMSEKNFIHYVRKLKPLGPTFIQGYPSAVSAIANLANDAGFSLAGPRAVFTSSETLMEIQRKAIEKAFGCRVYDWYGSAELAGSIGQCEKGNYHVNSEYGIIETDSSMMNDDSHYREIICTSFVNLGTPLIRYRIGDIVKTSNKKCSCGRGLPVVDEVLGRKDDVIITPRGVVLGSAALSLFFKETMGIREAQVIQEAANRLKVLVVPRMDAEAHDIEKLKDEFEKRVGSEMHVQFELVQSIEREQNGKFRTVISKLHGSTDS